MTLELAYRYSLLAILLMVVTMVVANYVTNPDRAPDMTQVSQVILAILPLLKAAVLDRRGPTTRLRTALEQLRHRRDNARLRRELETVRRQRGLVTEQLRQAEQRLAALGAIDRVNTVVAQLEAATAQLVAAIPPPAPPRRRQSRQELANG